MSNLEINSKRYYMRKLMNNNVLKLILCTGIFCGTNFAMEKEHVRPRIAKRNDDREKSEQYSMQQHQRKMDKDYNRMLADQDYALVVGGTGCLFVLYGVAWCYAQMNDLGRENS
jgi:tRNA A37 N6-isopentenylltransferase MiaA